MARITIYLPDEVERKARKAARAGGKSVSRWLATEVIRRLDDVLPQAIVDAAGVAPDFPDLAEIREAYGKDSRRESMR